MPSVTVRATEESLSRVVNHLVGPWSPGLSPAYRFSNSVQCHLDATRCSDSGSQLYFQVAILVEERMGKIKPAILS